jgi:NAD(P)-dependent dehydrogenase (short-subunit alcohol dehydrogenase family)
MLAQVAAREAGPHGVRVNVVAPGYIGTQAWMAKLGDRADELARTVPLRRIGRGEDVAGVVAWLLSELRSLCHRSSHSRGRGHNGRMSADHPKEAIEALFGRGWNLL